MKKLLILTILLISSCSTKDEISITDENKLFSVTKETAVLVCGGKSRLIESKNEEIIKVEIKESSSTEKENLFNLLLLKLIEKAANIELSIVIQIKILKNR